MNSHSGFCLSAYWQFRDSRATDVIELKPENTLKTASLSVAARTTLAE